MINRSVDKITDPKELMDVAIETVQDYIEEYAKEDKISMLFIEFVSAKYSLTKFGHVYKIMELLIMEEYWSPSLNSANKYKRPIVRLAFEFLKLYKELKKKTKAKYLLRI